MTSYKIFLLLLVVDVLSGQTINRLENFSDAYQSFEKCDSLVYTPILKGKLLLKDSTYLVDTYRNAMCQLKNGNEQKGLVYLEEFINRVIELKRFKYKSKSNLEFSNLVMGRYKSKKLAQMDSMFNIACEKAYHISFNNHNYKLASDVARLRRLTIKSIKDSDYFTWRFNEIEGLMKLHSENPISILKVFEDKIFDPNHRYHKFFGRDTLEFLIKENFTHKEYTDLLNRMEANATIILFDSSRAILQLNVDKFEFGFIDYEISRSISKQAIYCDTIESHIYGVYESEITIECEEPMKLKQKDWINNYLYAIRKTYLWNIGHIFTD